MGRARSFLLLFCSLLALIGYIAAFKLKEERYATVTRVLQHQNANSQATSAGNVIGANPPQRILAAPTPDTRYKTKTFPVTGSDDSECKVDKCSAWDWSNHTHASTSPDAPSSHLSPSYVPPFVRNMTYIPNFICFDGNLLRWTAETYSAFEDPVPAGYVVTQVRFPIPLCCPFPPRCPNPLPYPLLQATFTLTGTFVCDSPQTEFNIIFQGMPISVSPIVVNDTMYPQDCSCPACAQNFSTSTLVYPASGIPGYQYGASNQFSIFPLNGSLCLNSVEVRLYYQPRLPILQKIWPNGGPRTGDTTVSISLDNFDASYTYTCQLPIGTIPATKIPNESRIDCVTPKPCATGEGRVLFSVSLTNTHGESYPIGNQMWTVYNEPELSKVSPSRGMIGDSVIISGQNLVPPAPQSELSWLCRIGGVISAGAISNGTHLNCTIPTGIEVDTELTISAGLNGADWSNTLPIYVSSSPISPTATSSPNKWYQMPTVLYIVLGSIAGILAVIIVTFFIYRVTCGKRVSSSQRLLDEDAEPFLKNSGDGSPTERNSFGPRTPYSIDRSELAALTSEFEKIDVSKLKLGKRIGKGSFGEVYLGHYLGTDVAVKKILANKITPEFTGEFAREAALMRDLRHPNVVQFIGAAFEEPDICIVTEYMSQGSLYHLLHDPNVKISWEMVRKIALDAARGMAYLHLRTPAIIHRDLKSHNLLVDNNWKVKVCDFGLSRIAVDLHKTMTACGTPCWTAPEILRNARYTTKADVFSYGIVLWELVTRDEPFAGMPAFQVIFAVGTKGVRLPLPAVCPPELIKLITSCWQEDPSLRPPFSDIITYLERISFAPEGH